jgi:hypothetical protein
MAGCIGQGEHIEAKVNGENHALSIRQTNKPQPTEEATVVAIPKIIGVMTCSLVLSLGLSNAMATERTGPDPCADRKGGQPDLSKCDEETRQGIVTVKGEVLRFEGNNVLVQRFDGKEVTLHIDATTQMSGYLGRGERIEAKVSNMDDQKHAMSIRQLE